MLSMFMCWLLFASYLFWVDYLLIFIVLFWLFIDHYLCMHMQYHIYYDEVVMQ